MAHGPGVVAAVVAAMCFAGAGVVQQRAAARMPPNRSLSIRLILDLARQPMWLAGIGLAAAAWGFQALALSRAPLVVVQPLLVTELIFALPLSARLGAQRMGAREWSGVLAVALGIAATEWGSSASGGGDGTPRRWAIATFAVVVLAVALAAWGRTDERPPVKASLFAAAAALVEGLAAALLAVTVAGFRTDGLGGLARPAPYAMAVATLANLVLEQSAFQAGPLAVTMPILDWLGPLSAVVLGVGVLQESINTSPRHLSVLALGALVTLAGIVTLDTSPRVRILGEEQARLATSPSNAPPSRRARIAASARDCRACRRGRWWPAFVREPRRRREAH